MKSYGRTRGIQSFPLKILEDFLFLSPFSKNEHTVGDGFMQFLLNDDTTHDTLVYWHRETLRQVKVFR
jgi:hypothetical protein